MSVAAHGQHAHAADTGREINWWGMVFFISSEALIFANLIAAYLYLQIRGLQTPGGAWVMPETGHTLDWIFPAVNTIFLLASSIPAVYARRSIMKGNQRGLVLGLLGTIILGSIFLGGQVYEYSVLMGEGLSLSGGDLVAPARVFGSAFFLLTGFHGVHVTIGVLFLVVCLIRAMRGDFSAQKHFVVEAGEMYWHFVDFVWIFVFAVVYVLPQFLPAGIPAAGVGH